MSNPQITLATFPDIFAKTLQDAFLKPVSNLEQSTKQNMDTMNNQFARQIETVNTNMDTRLNSLSALLTEQINKSVTDLANTMYRRNEIDSRVNGIHGRLDSLANNMYTRNEVDQRIGNVDNRMTDISNRMNETSTRVTNLGNSVYNRTDIDTLLCELNNRLQGLPR